MRIAYCDDEKAQYIYVQELVNTWENETKEPCELCLYSCAEEMLFENQESFSFDFILLDIELSNTMNGVELARKIRQVDQGVTIAFLSNSREYVFEGYEVGAVRYLLKPITGQQLFPLLDQIRKFLKEEKPYLIIRTQGDNRKVMTEDILYIEALGHYNRICTGTEAFEVKQNLNEFKDMLKNSFLLTHRSYLVNLKYIERITRTECILDGGRSVPVSRNSYQMVNQAFIEFNKGGTL